MSISFTYRNIQYKPSNIFGFKIHISATFENYKHILDIVVPFLDKEKVTYKFIDNESDIFHNFSVFEDAAESGKLITIYPKPNLFREVIEKLYQILPQEADGIYILSDRNYKDSNILFYRFGLVQHSANSIQNGIPTLTTAEGDTWQDYPKTYFNLPPWIDDIQEEIMEEESYLENNYEVLESLHNSNGGNIYLCQDKKFSSFTVLKESRPNILSFHNIEKRELRQKEYEITKKLQELEVSNVLRPIECVDEWINRYFIYNYIEGETLLDICKEYGINAYSRQHKTKNLRLFNQFLVVVKSLVNQINYFHSKQLILNDIHSENFIMDDSGQVHFIDLENSYFYGEKPFVGIESQISLRQWNHLDGKVADYHKLGNTILCLLARLYIREHPNKEIEILEDLLLSYGIKTNLTDFISYLLSDQVNAEGVTAWLEQLSSYSVEVREKLPNVEVLEPLPFLDRVKTICSAFNKYEKYLLNGKDMSVQDEAIVRSLMSAENNLGIGGLSGILVLFHTLGLDNLVEEGVDLLLSRLVESDEELLVPIGNGFYSPYIYNGLSGIIQALYFIDKKKYRKLIMRLRKNLLVQFAQYEEYDRGMLGIADTLLLTMEYRTNKSVIQCVESLILNSYIYHRHRSYELSDFKKVLNTYYRICSQ